MLEFPVEVLPERVLRTYRGGRLLEVRDGRVPAVDGNYPEEWILSTVEAVSPDGGTAGLCKAFCGGRTVLLRELSVLTQQQRRLDNLVNSWALRDPERLFADQEQRLDTASRRLREALELHLQQDEHKLALAAARLDSLSPLAVLGRGYSVSQKSDYTLVSSVDDLRWGDELLTTVADGVITSVVQQVERR